jgi:hypothetical protein
VRAGRKAAATRLTTRGAGGSAYHSQRSGGWWHVSATAAAVAESHLGVVMKKRRRSKHERATMKIEDKIDQNRGDRRVSHVVHRGEREIIDFGSIPYYE